MNLGERSRGSAIETLGNSKENRGGGVSMESNKHKSDQSIEMMPSPFKVPKSSDNIVFILGCLLYITYYMSVAVDSQFLSLYYKSKGFEGSTIGWLYSLTPMTTFIMVPVWSWLTSRENNGKHQIQILCLSILLATACQLLLAFLDRPVYMIPVVIAAGIFQSPAKPLLDGLIMDHLEDQTIFGKIRVFSTLGSGLGANLGGWLLSVAKDSSTDHDSYGTHRNSLFHFVRHLPSGFNLLFLARLFLTAPTILLIRKLSNDASTTINGHSKFSAPHIDEKQRVDKLSNNCSPQMNPGTSLASLIFAARTFTSQYFSNTNHVLFFTCIYISGASGGVSDAFTYLRYEESGCSTAHMGQSRLLASVAGAVMFWYSGRLSQFLGIKNVFVLSLICHGTRFSLLRRMDSMYYIYIIDLIRGSTYGAFWSSSTIYASEIGTPRLRATTLLLLNGLYNGLGRSSGAIIGGRFEARFGTNHLLLWCSRINFLYAAVMATVYYRQFSAIENKVREDKKVK